MNGKSIAFSSPKAAPVLCTRVRSKKPGMTSTLSYSVEARPHERHLVAWSTIDHQTAAIQTCSGRCAVTSGGRLRPAPSTQRSQMPAHAGSVLDAGDEAPAALALHAGGLLDLARVTSSAPSRRADVQGDVRDDEQHRQLRPVRLEQRRDSVRSPSSRRAHRASCRSPCPCASVRAPRCTWSRTASRRSHVPSSRLVEEAIDGREVLEVHRQSDRVPGRCRHSSSAVTGRIGASRRARPSQIRYITVCVERRSGDRRAERVHPVLGHVDVERAEVDGREHVQRLRTRWGSRRLA